MDENYALDLNEGDFLTNRRTTIQSMNLSTSLIKENREKIYSKVFYVFSLIFAVLISVFANSLNWFLVLLFLDLSLIVLILFAKDYYKLRRKLAEDHDKIIKRLGDFGIKIKKQ